MRFSRKQLGIPYAVFLICFVIAPLLVVLYYAFTNGQGQFTVQNFVNFFTSENTIGTLAYSLVTAMTVTAGTFYRAHVDQFYPSCGRIKRSADHGGRKPGISSVFEYGAWYDL